jgi:hypothetical protein
MSMPLVVILAAFWAFLVFRAFERGDMVMAAIFAVVGAALTINRLKALKNTQKD